MLARSSAPVGKQHTLARHILAHSSGWSAWPEALLKSDGTGFDDYDAIAAQLAAEPAWEPGTKSVYLALTFGWLVNELIRRISGTALGAVFRDEVAPPGISTDGSALRRTSIHASATCTRLPCRR